MPRRSSGGSPNPLLLRLLGFGGGNDDLGKVNFVSSAQPGAITNGGDLQGINWSQKAEPNHWWNGDSARRVNNATTLAGIQGRQAAGITTDQAVDQFKKLTGPELDRLEMEGKITNQQKAEIAQKLSDIAIEQNRVQEGDTVIANGGALPSVETRGLFGTNAINETAAANQLQKLTTEARGGQAKLEGINDTEEIARAVHPELFGKAVNDAKAANQLSGLTLGDTATKFGIGQKVEALKPALVQSEINKNNTILETPGTQHRDAVTGAITAGPAPLPVQTLKAFKDMAAPTGGNTPGNPPVTALPAPLVPTAPQDGSVIKQNGKWGKVRNGIFTEYPGQ